LVRRLLAILALLLASGCASLGGDDPRDPFEGLNRGVYRFNEEFDEWLAKPVARTYRSVLHQEIRTRIANFFSNLGDPLIGVNNFLQGKFEDGVNDIARFAFNSTFGLLGIHDVASEWGFEKHNEDFGQTFGHWGAGPGPYLMLPILSSSTLRDGIGLGFDWTFDPLSEVRPINLRNSLVVLRGVNLRADLLDASRLLEEAALDKYVFQRDAYLQRRRSLIYDGSPPREKLE
jgi:phospholipid-binding lipoprotein MlaA